MFYFTVCFYFYYNYKVSLFTFTIMIDKSMSTYIQYIHTILNSNKNQNNYLFSFLLILIYCIIIVFTFSLNLINLISHRKILKEHTAIIYCTRATHTELYLRKEMVSCFLAKNKYIKLKQNTYKTENQLF